MMSIGIPTRALRTTFLEARVDFLALFRERGELRGGAISMYSKCLKKVRLAASPYFCTQLIDACYYYKKSDEKPTKN
jgi:hypothetical protein